MTEIFYKYRTLDNFKNFVDIILNNRLFAARYSELNDPMEGQYLFKDGILSRNIKNRIYGDKQQLRLCSLSKNCDNFLMWSHYANGHKGVAIGVQIDETKYTVKDIDYIENLRSFEKLDDLDAINILCSKVDLWQYENEVRAFNRNGDNYINVKVVELYVGSRMAVADLDFITNLVKKINPTIKILRAQLEM